MPKSKGSGKEKSKEMVKMGPAVCGGLSGGQAEADTPDGFDVVMIPGFFQFPPQIADMLF